MSTSAAALAPHELAACARQGALGFGLVTECIVAGVALAPQLLDVYAVTLTAGEIKRKGQPGVVTGRGDV
jgi:hypothetical protein